MGFTPAQVGEMSPWEFQACVDGYIAANGGGEKAPSGRPMTAERMRELGIEGF